MENEKLTYINSRGERLELGVDSVYHCNISKDVEGISGVTSVIYSTNSMGQHGDTYVGQRIEARDIDVVGHINTRDKAQALELRRRMLKIFNPELSATLVYEYGGFKRVIDCRAYGEPKILKKEVLYKAHKAHYQEVRERENHKRAVTKEYTELDGTRRTRRQL